MEKFLCVCVFLLGGIVPMLNASSSLNQPKAFQQVTVLSVDQHQVQSPASQFGAGDPSDAPLTSNFYTYHVSFRLECRTYVGRYETPFRYLPSAFAPNHPIQVRLTKHVMYFNLPNDPELRMSIVNRRIDKGQACESANSKL